MEVYEKETKKNQNKSMGTTFHYSKKAQRVTKKISTLNKSSWSKVIRLECIINAHHNVRHIIIITIFLYLWRAEAPLPEGSSIVSIILGILEYK